MEEIKVGELVRTNKGLIDKVIDIKEAGSGIRYGGESFKDTIVILTPHGDCLNETRVALTDIVKHSKNIKDLVEAGDYVNGLEVYKGKTANGEEKLLVGSYMINGMALEVVNIKTIVTKEQFASLEYKI